jgi:hypothetical protein
MRAFGIQCFPAGLCFASPTAATRSAASAAVSGGDCAMSGGNRPSVTRGTGRFLLSGAFQD